MACKTDPTKTSCNEREDPLTLPFNGGGAKGRITTNLDVGIARWYPEIKGAGGVSLYNDNIYLESKRNADGTYSEWKQTGNVFNEIRASNSALKSSYSSNDVLAKEFFSAGKAPGSPVGTLNNGRYNQFSEAPLKRDQLNIPKTTNVDTSTGPKEDDRTAEEKAKQEADATPVATFDPTKLQVGETTGLTKSLKGKVFRYPLNLGNNKSQQDYIKFNIIESTGRVINQATTPGSTDVKIDTSFGKRTFSDVISTIILPIQSGINDENSVTWGGEDLDAISAYFAGKSFNAIENGLGKTLEQTFSEIGSALSDKGKGYETALKVYLAGQAVGTNNLLSRTTGAIINPNLELLFQGPTLRPFNFTFRLSPREEAEATQIKSIIRVFKEASAVRKTNAELFLKAPYVFEIQYIDGSTNSVHNSINLIKKCALLSFGVNYTPENTYMTFNDSQHSMVSYELSLRFSELEPITSEDYGTHPIGY